MFTLFDQNLLAYSKVSPQHHYIAQPLVIPNQMDILKVQFKCHEQEKTGGWEQNNSNLIRVIKYITLSACTLGSVSTPGKSTDNWYSKIT